MVTTRLQGRSQASRTETHEPHAGEKRPHSKASPTKAKEPVTKQRVTEPHGSSEPRELEGDQQKMSDSTTTPTNLKISQLISTCGDLPLADTDLSNPDKATSDTILALLLDAMPSSTRISHQLAAKTVAAMIKAGYHNISVLKEST
ncbi:hypothetical protein F5X99DRAFT_404133 [Biscogniauxia marginata]|nr:hypothetical protein F5X99DRAFT_404133 [Biscogniauxia marginata]